jgi:hypothetical protein
MGIEDTSDENKQLMRNLKFNSKDLDANRHGVLTTAQCRRLLWWQIQWMLSVSVIALLFIGWCILAYPLPPNQLLNTPVVWVFLSIILAVVLWMIWFWQRTRRIVMRGKVAAHHGPAICYRKKLILSGTGISGPFVEGGIYTVHVLPGINYLLSIECHANPKQAGKFIRQQRRQEESLNQGG